MYLNCVNPFDSVYCSSIHGQDVTRQHHLAEKRAVATTTEIGEAAIKVFQIYGNKEGEQLYKIRCTL